MSISLTTAAGTPWEHGSVHGRLTAGLIQPVPGWVVCVWVAGAGLLAGRSSTSPEQLAFCCCYADKSCWIVNNILFVENFLTFPLASMCQTYQKAVRGSAGRSHPQQAPAPCEQGNWAARVGGYAFPLGTLQSDWNSAVKSGCWVISRLILPIAVSTEVPIYSTWQMNVR